MEKVKQVNFNTILTTLVLIIGFFCKHTLDQVEIGQTELRHAMMPRQEIELQIQSVKNDSQRIELQIKDFRIRLDQFELELIRIRKP